VVNAIYRTNLDAGAALAAFLRVDRLCLAVGHNIYFHGTHIEAFPASSAFFVVNNDSCQWITS